MKLTIAHPDVGLGLFTAEKIRKCEVVEYYYGSLIYSSLAMKRQLNKTFKEGVM